MGNGIELFYDNTRTNKIRESVRSHPEYSLEYFALPAL